MKKSFTPLEIQKTKTKLRLPKGNLSLTGFTLLELIVVMVIIAILAVISFPKFSTMKETSVDQEAIANLKLIQAAEKIYKMEMAFYAPLSSLYPSGSDDVSLINGWLKLAIPTAGVNWKYKIEAPPSSTFTGKAQRTTDATKVKCIDETNTDPYSCPW